MFFTYVLHSPKFDRIYIGQTNNIRNRTKQHNSGKVKSTKTYISWELVHYEKFETRPEAMKREKELKSHKGRDYIRKNLINGRVRQLPD